jgi:hypothetical protein
LHSTVFLEGSDEGVVQPAAAHESLEYVAGYLQRLEGGDLDRVQADIAALVEFARQEKWPKAQVQFLKNFLAEFGVTAARGPV